VRQKPAAVLLDLDDTILDDSGCVDECWSEAAATAEQMVPGLQATELLREIRAYAEWWWADPGRNRSGRLDLRTATTGIVEEAFRRLGYGDQSVPASIANHYRDLREERAQLHADAIQTIEWFRSQGVRLGLMTNGAGPPQRAKIERFDLAPYFGHIVIEGELGTGKPDPMVFQSLLAALDAEPDEAWAVGDNLEADVLGAQQLGIHGIWINRHGKDISNNSGRPDRVIQTLHDLIG
jgi:putative hydrolase of the HAD superfamily